MLLIGYLYGIKSERRLEEEVSLTLHTAGSVALTLHRECRIIQPLARIDDDAFRILSIFREFLMKLYSNACSLGLYQEKRALLTALSSLQCIMGQPLQYGRDREPVYL